MRPTQARISTTALRHNLSIVQKALSRGTRVMGVVKANCYGHEAEVCLPPLQEGGVDVFGVATVEEARELRYHGIRDRIVLLTSPFLSEREAFPELDIEPLISDKETARWLSATAEAHGIVLQSHIYIDTGMTRNGANPEEALELTRYVSQLPGLALKGIASHFATSGSPDHSYALQQLSQFDGTYREVRDAGFDFDEVHIANSGGILNFPDSHYTLVRPGIALYGYHPAMEEQKNSGFHPVMSLYSVVSSMRRVPEGRAVSYGARYRTSQETYIATLPIGYGDGLMRQLTGKLDVLVKDSRYPVVGTICMDEIMIDLGPTTSVAVGDEVCLIGTSGEESISAWDIAEKGGTIAYEITTMISQRVPRRAIKTIEEHIL